MSESNSMARTVAWLELALCLAPLTVVWLAFAPMAAGLGAQGARRLVTAGERVSPYFDDNEADPDDVPRRKPSSLYDGQVAAQRARGVRELVPLLWVTGGLAGIIALWRLVLPRARGVGAREALSRGLVVGLTCGGLVAVWVLLAIEPSGPPEKAYLTWSLQYSAGAALGVAIHQASTVLWRRRTG